MEGNKETNKQVPPLPPLPPSNLGRQNSSNNYSPSFPLAPPSHQTSANSDKGKGLAETTDHEPNSEIPNIVEIPRDDDEPAADRKKQKLRTLLSREYAQRYRFKQHQHIQQLESQMTYLKIEIDINTPRVKYADRRNMLLIAENEAIRQKISVKATELMFKEAQYVELKKEIDSLIELYEAMLLAAEHAPFNNPMGYPMTNFGPNQPGVGLGVDQFHGPTGPVDIQKLNQTNSLSQFAVGESSVDMNNMNMTNVQIQMLHQTTNLSQFTGGESFMDMSTHVQTQMLNQTTDLSPFAAGESFVDMTNMDMMMNNMDMLNNIVGTNNMDMTHMGMNNMDMPHVDMDINPMDMINDDHDM